MINDLLFTNGGKFPPRTWRGRHDLLRGWIISSSWNALIGWRRHDHRGLRRLGIGSIGMALRLHGPADHGADGQRGDSAEDHARHKRQRLFTQATADDATRDQDEGDNTQS